MQRPAYYAINKIHIEQTPQKRMMIVFKGAPCIRFREGKKCLGCSYEEHLIGYNEFNLLQQFLSVKKILIEKKVKHLDILSSGSVLDDTQIEFSQLMLLIKEIAKLEIDSLLLEGRVEFFSVEKINTIKEALGNIKLEYGVGLESWSDDVRNGILGKGLKIDQYKKFVKIAHENKVRVVTYVLFGVPGLSTKEAIIDSATTIKKITDYYKKINHVGRICLFPFFVPKGNPVEKLFQENNYRLVELKDILELVKKTLSLVDTNKYHIYIGMDDEELSGGNKARPKTESENKIFTLIENFNYRQKL